MKKFYLNIFLYLQSYFCSKLEKPINKKGKIRPQTLNPHFFLFFFYRINSRILMNFDRLRFFAHTSLKNILYGKVDS